jgi:hypothetical protein
MRRVLRLLSVLAILPASIARSAEPLAKRLIEFGWDEPDTTFLRAHIQEMERTPFDGCVFHANAVSSDGKRESFTWLVWGQRRFTDLDLKPALDDLKATPLHRFSHNFLRFNTTPGDLDWFDDHGAVVANARLAGRFAREGKCRGILLDIEQYEKPLFNYRKQRNASTKSWDDYAAQARRRGRDVMSAFQDGFPGITILLTFGHSLPRYQMKEGKVPLSETDYGLLAPFLDGMIVAAEGSTRIIDGFELSYGYRQPERFAEGRALIRRGVLPIVGDPEKYAEVVSVGFGLWLDYDQREYGWNAEDPSKNYFTPESLERSVHAAIEQSDEIVWIYTETPRWWSEGRTSVKLPEVYPDALRRARLHEGTPR